MDKFTRLEQVLAGELPDRPLVALWRHWPGDDQRAADFAKATITFQQTFDWDFVKVTPFSMYSVADYGVQTAWQGNIQGNRTRTKSPITRSLEWTELRTLEPMRGQLGKHLETLRIVAEVLPDTPIITTIYSPITQAALMAGDILTMQHMRTHSNRLQTALNTITESTLRFVEALKRIAIHGIFFVMKHASLQLMSEQEYAQFAAPYDRKILDSLSSNLRYNVAQPDCPAPMFDLAASYPVASIAWDTVGSRPTIERALSSYSGTLCGGLCHEQHIHHGTPSIIRDVARQTINQIGSRRLILAANDAVPVSTPLSNMWALREVVESMRNN